MKTFIGLLLGLSISFGSYCYSFQPMHSSSLRVKNLRRDFYFYVPKNVAANPRLVFVLHGSGMIAKGMQVLTGRGFDKIADENRDVIVVYPQGYGRYWNDCRKAATFDARKLNIDDIGFFEGMVKYFTEKYGVDEHKVFVTGYSDGGDMCFKLAKESPDLFRGFATVAASLPIETNDDCTETRKPVSILLLNGTSDPINPYKGGTVKAGDGKKRGDVMSTNNTVQYWLAVDQCDTTTKKEYTFPDINENDKSTAVKYTYDSPKTGKKVVLVKVINGGHIYVNPGFHIWPRVLGNVNKDIDTPEIIMEFFRSLQ